MSEAITEKELNTLSKKLGEPEGILKWRIKLLNQVNENPEEKNCSFFNKSKLDIEKLLSSDSVEYNYKKDSGIKILRWKEAMENPALTQTICEHLNKKNISFAKNCRMVLNAVLFSDGCVVQAPANSTCSATIETRFLENTSDILIVIAKNGSRLSVFDKTDIGDKNSGRTTIVIAEDNAKVEFYNTVFGKGEFLNNKIAIVENNAEVNFLEVITQTATVESHSTHFLVGSGAKGVIKTALVGNKNAQFYSGNTIHHLADNTRSLITASGVAGGFSHIKYQGLIDVKNDVCNAEGEQKAKFLMVSPNAKINAIPALDIASKDISCSHSVSISHFQDKDLYYPKLRGISAKKAKQLIATAMLSRELSQAQNREASELLKESIAKAISGIF